MPAHLIARRSDEIALQRASCRTVVEGAAQQSEKDLLRHFFGGFAPAAHVQRKAKDGTLMTPVQHDKRFLAPASSTTQQVLIIGIGNLTRGFHNRLSAFYLYAVLRRGG